MSGSFHHFQRLAAAASAPVGAVLEGGFYLVGKVRPSSKPLHPVGQLRSATITRIGATAKVGVPFIDNAGVSRAIVRLSRATGLPTVLPDIHGLAIRVFDPPAPHGDILLATTGLGPALRFTLSAARESRRRAYTSLIPYRTPTGARLIAAIPNQNDELEFELCTATLRGPWLPFARLRLEPTGAETDTGDNSISFDPVLNKLSGLDYYPWASRLRAGAYRGARRSRRDTRLTSRSMPPVSADTE